MQGKTLSRRAATDARGEFDGGYAMCRNTLRDAAAAFSIGINGWDAWGVEVSDVAKVPVFELDCTNSLRPVCPPEYPACNLTFVDKCIGFDRVRKRKRTVRMWSRTRTMDRNGGGPRRWRQR